MNNKTLHTLSTHCICLRTTDILWNFSRLAATDSAAALSSLTTAFLSSIVRMCFEYCSLLIICSASTTGATPCAAGLADIVCRTCTPSSGPNGLNDPALLRRLCSCSASTVC